MYHPSLKPDPSEFLSQNGNCLRNRTDLFRKILFTLNNFSLNQ